ncbi:unnamed protein product, partial [Timema podura]|nr:unnamed protein product [Timema podura]
MAVRIAKCPHMTLSVDFQQSDLDRAKEISKCSECDSRGPNLWLCLHRGCHRIGCGEVHNDHSTVHNRTCRSHCIHLNMSTHRVWCYMCENEVFLEQSDSGGLRPIVHNGPSTLGDSGDSSDSEDSRDDNGKPR